MVEIDTLWNVKCVTGMTLKDRFLVEIDVECKGGWAGRICGRSVVEIDTLWNVKVLVFVTEWDKTPVEIDTLWNVKHFRGFVRLRQIG